MINHKSKTQSNNFKNIKTNIDSNEINNKRKEIEIKIQ